MPLGIPVVNLLGDAEGALNTHDIAQLPGSQEVLQEQEQVGRAAMVTDEQSHTVLMAAINDGLSILGSVSDGLLEQNELHARLAARNGGVLMQGVWQRDDRSVHLLGSQQVMVVAVELSAHLGSNILRLLAEASDARELRVLVLLQQAGDASTLVQTEHGHLHICHSDPS